MGDHYGAIKFGEFRKYMQHKQSKLKDQEQELEQTATQNDRLLIFRGLSIYINGYTNPSQRELRRLIILHGGDYQHYLKKSSVTHIIASNLTQSKMNEFRSYKVVQPSWIVDSIEAKHLQPWQKYRTIAKEAAQKELPFAPKGKELNETLLANRWNKENTVLQPGFLEKYYEQSRLHHLSTWRAELKDMVRRIQQKHDISKKKPAEGPRIVMHVDFDCFFATASLLDRPHLRDKPVAVAHSQGKAGESSSDIASCNYIARAYGVCNGMQIGAAKKLCPELQIIPYEFEKYKAISETFYDILFGYAIKLQAVSVDEALIEVDGGGHSPELLAKEIRDVIREKTQCEASVGIGSNILLARLATKRAKPAAQFYCADGEAADFLKDLDVSELPGVGYKMSRKLKDELDVSTVSELVRVSLEKLQKHLGPKTGKMLHNFARGIDDRELQLEQPRQSVSADVNWGVRFENQQQAEKFVKELAEQVSMRLKNISRRGKGITIKILKRQIDAGEAAKRLGCGDCDSFSKSVTLGYYTDDAVEIGNRAYQMFVSFRFDPTDIRGIGIQIQKLDDPSEKSTNAQQQQRLYFQLQPTDHLSDETERTPAKMDALASPSRIADVGPCSPVDTFVPTATGTAAPSPSATMEPFFPQSKKLTMSVDRAVFSELPEDVQIELGRTHDLTFIEPGSNEDAEWAEPQPAEPGNARIPPESQPILPPWSQIDPGVLLALPEHTRQQMLEAYSKSWGERKHSKKVSAMSTTESDVGERHYQKAQRPTLDPPQHAHPIPSPSNNNKRRRKTTNQVPSPSKGERTLTQMFPSSGISHGGRAMSPKRYPRSPTRTTREARPIMHTVGKREDKPPYDMDIWNELPPDLKQEILSDYRREKEMRERSLANERFREAHDKLVQQKKAHVLNIPLLEEPALMGKSDPESIRDLIRQWVAAFPEQPEPEDEDLFATYLCELVRSKNIEKAQLFMQYISHLACNERWRECVLRMREKINDQVIAIYHCPLRFS